MRFWRYAARAGSGVLLLASFGCWSGSAQLRAGAVYGHPVYYVDAPPAYYREYPRVRYRGRPAYLIGGRWYYATPRGWVYFREEPRELRRYREFRYGRVDRDRYRATPRGEESRSERRRGRTPYEEPIERRRRSIDD